MSVFAGQIAAEFCLDTLLKKNIVPKKIVISGGGIAGRAALGKIISGCDHSVKTIIIDPSAETCSTLRQIYPENVEVIQDSIIGDSISDADAVMLTAFVRGRPAPDVLEIGNISGMKRDSVIVDVSIDEKGGIWIPRYDKSRENLSDVVLRMRSEIDKMGKGITYLADDHLPKNRPFQASEIHGRAILPYIATLLYCSADQGGPENLAKYIKRGEFEKSKQMTEILGHLRRGLAFFNPSTIMYNNSILERGFQDPFKDALDTEPF